MRKLLGIALGYNCSRTKQGWVWSIFGLETTHPYELYDSVADTYPSGYKCYSTWIGGTVLLHESLKPKH